MLCPTCKTAESVYKGTKECQSCYGKRNYREIKERMVKWRIKKGITK